jgi:Flp pilus assembly protein TadD
MVSEADCSLGTMVFFFFMWNKPTAAILLVVLSGFGVTAATHISIGGQSNAQTKADVAPFDKLELFAFLAARPMNSYAAYVIQQRGTDFTPGNDFISIFPDKRNILENLKPRAARKMTADRDRAYELARKANDDWGRFSSASEKYQQALQLAPDSATLHLANASVLLLAHNYASADEQARLSIQIWPEDAEAHVLLGLCMMQQRRNADAELEAKEVLRVFPQHATAKFILAHSLINEHKYQEALPAIRDAKAVLPSTTALTKFLGIALFETGDTAGGILQLSVYLKMEPSDAEAHYMLGVALRQKGDAAKAHEQFLEAARLQPNIPQFEAAAHPDGPTATTSETPGPKPEDGNVSGNIYTNNFFGFRYQYPNGWSVLSKEAARGMIEVGGNMISTGDPTEQDLKNVGKRNGHTLFFAMEAYRASQPLSGRSIVVSAIDLKSVPTTAEAYVKAFVQRFNQEGGALEAKGTPAEVTKGGREFWRQQFLIHTATGTLISEQFATTEKAYLLLFGFSATSAEGLSDVEKTLDSLQFTPDSN